MPQSHQDYFLNQPETNITRLLVTAFNLMEDVREDIEQLVKPTGPQPQIIQNQHIIVSKSDRRVALHQAKKRIEPLENQILFPTTLTADASNQTMSLAGFIAKLHDDFIKKEISINDVADLLFTKTQNGLSLWHYFVANQNFLYLLSNSDLYDYETRSFPLKEQVHPKITDFLARMAMVLIAQDLNDELKQKICAEFANRDMGCYGSVTSSHLYSFLVFLEANGTEDQKKYAFEKILNHFGLIEENGEYNLDYHNDGYSWSFLLNNPHPERIFNETIGQLKHIDHMKPGVAKAFFVKPQDPEDIVCDAQVLTDGFMTLYYDKPNSSSERYARMCQLAIEVLDNFDPSVLSDETIKMFVPFREGIFTIHKSKPADERAQISIQALNPQTSLGKLITIPEQGRWLHSPINYRNKYSQLAIASNISVNTSSSSSFLGKLGFSRRD